MIGGIASASSLTTAFGLVAGLLVVMAAGAGVLGRPEERASAALLVTDES